MNFPKKQRISFNLFAVGLALLIASAVAGFIDLVILGIFAINFDTESVNLSKINHIIIIVVILGIPLACGIGTFIHAYRYLAKVFEKQDGLK